jgi:hypothetical protein
MDPGSAEPVQIKPAYWLRRWGRELVINEGKAWQPKE